MNLITFFSEMAKLAKGVYGCPRTLNIENRTATLDFSGRGIIAGDVAVDCYLTLVNAGYESVADIQCDAGKVIAKLNPANSFDPDKTYKGLLF